MENEKIIEDAISKSSFKNDLIGECKLLYGGMSNENYVVSFSSTDKKAFVRIPHGVSNMFVNLTNEKFAIEEIERHLNEFSHFIVPVDYFGDNGVMVREYFDGKSLAEKESVEDNIKEVSEMLINFHNYCNYDKLLEPWCNVFTRLLEYKSIANVLGDIDLKQDLYDCVLNNVGYIYSLMIKDGEDFKFCHGDCQPSNFLQTKSHGLKLLDFEFCCKCDPIYDIACFGNVNDEAGVNLLEEYYHGDINKNRLTRFYYWRMFQALQWYYSAMVKDKIGDNKFFDVDFKGYADNCLIKIDKYKKLINL